MGWLVLSVLGVLLAIQVVALMVIRARRPALPKSVMEIHSAASPDDSALDF